MSLNVCHLTVERAGNDFTLPVPGPKEALKYGIAVGDFSIYEIA